MANQDIATPSTITNPQHHGDILPSIRSPRPPRNNDRQPRINLRPRQPVAAVRVSSRQLRYRYLRDFAENDHDDDHDDDEGAAGFADNLVCYFFSEPGSWFRVNSRRFFLDFRPRSGLRTIASAGRSRSSSKRKSVQELSKGDGSALSQERVQWCAEMDEG